MELWVRSQDKTTLIKCSEIYIADVTSNYLIREAGTSHTLGAYKSIDRALEVLDEIQHLLSPMLIFKNCNCTKEMLENIKEAGTCVVSDNAHIEQIQTCIYEMPEE